eukprot:scaffold312334_cov42-Prasinocladus_malaysianus.AAC.1
MSDSKQGILIGMASMQCTVRWPPVANCQLAYVGAVSLLRPGIGEMESVQHNPAGLLGNL